MKFKKSKLSLSLTDKNVFINEYGSSVNSYRLLPRYFLLSANFRFLGFVYLRCSNSIISMFFISLPSISKRSIVRTL